MFSEIGSNRVLENIARFLVEALVVANSAIEKVPLPSDFQSLRQVAFPFSHKNLHIYIAGKRSE